MQKEVKIFKALSDDNRLKILDKSCCCGGACVKDLAKHLGVSVPTASHHVKQLLNAGLIETKKDGKWVYCCINKEGAKKLDGFLKKILKNKKVA